MSSPRDIPQHSNREQITRHEVTWSSEYDADPMTAFLTPYSSSSTSYRSDFSIASRTNRDIIVLQNQHIRSTQQRILAILGDLEVFLRPDSADPPQTFPQYEAEDDAACLLAETDVTSDARIAAAQNRYLMTTQGNVMALLTSLARCQLGVSDDDA
ncbi:hypothetical protein PFICI_11009 [Pestalotiopsis fici W106-1]|uniref:Uncharacterized protein n=1 Tax=Pestalotiopsis fici (strain W106-1 / CGMCC3.15140) TaxID=1229662 RepID=W3WTG2_PESFW|nr:uncharacterized protein PFICI_11009 [Pestalotiopsis fici W106-1]ETS77135.1 hypothetical protein PFICI_11009 [Pestalotiopsis fici W106-1]